MNIRDAGALCDAVRAVRPVCYAPGEERVQWGILVDAVADFAAAANDAINIDAIRERCGAASKPTETKDGE